MKKNIEKFKQFVSDNSSTIFKCVGGITLTAAAMLLDIPVEISPKRTPSYTSFNSYAYRRSTPTLVYSEDGSSQERAILALVNSTRSMTWDSDKLSAAERIKNIAKESDDDDVCRAAIAALEDISNGMTWGSYKSKISKYIYEIAMN